MYNYRIWYRRIEHIYDLSPNSPPLGNRYIDTYLKLWDIRLYRVIILRTILVIKTNIWLITKVVCILFLSNMITEDNMLL